MRKKRIFRGIRALLLCAAAAFILVLPFSALAQNPEQKTVRVGWYDSSFCYWDEFGRRCGIDAEYQEKISAYTGWTYEYVEDSWSNLFRMLKDGEIDCVFPVNLNSYDAAGMDVRVTAPVIKTGMNAVMRASDQQSLSRDSRITFAIHPDDLNIETFIMDEYPLSVRKQYGDGRSCFGAVASGDADCILVSAYRMPAAEKIMAESRLFSVPTGENMPLSFAVNRADRELYFILNKTAVMKDSADMDSALASYMHADQKVSFAQFLKEHWLSVVLSLLAVFTVIIVLLLQKLKAERTANLTARMITCMRTRTS